jgi:hypothetical protein
MAGKTPVAPTREPTKRFISHYSPKLYTWLTGIKLEIKRAPAAQLPIFNKLEDARVAVVTVYEKESSKVLQALHDSLQDDSLNMTHYFVSNNDNMKKHSLRGDNIKYFHLHNRYPNNGALGYGLCGMIAFKVAFDVIFFVNADYQFKQGFLKSSIDKMWKNKVDIAYFLDDKLSEDKVSFRPVMISRRMAFAAMIYAQLSSVGEKFIRGMLTLFCKQNGYKLVKVKSDLIQLKDKQANVYEESSPDQVKLPELVRHLTGWSFGKPKSQSATV